MHPVLPASMGQLISYLARDTAHDEMRMVILLPTLLPPAAPGTVQQEAAAGPDGAWCTSYMLGGLSVLRSCAFPAQVQLRIADVTSFQLLLLRATPEASTQEPSKACVAQLGCADRRHKCTEAIDVQLKCYQCEPETGTHAGPSPGPECSSQVFEQSLHV